MVGSCRAPSQSISPDRDEVSNKYAFVRDLLPLIEDCREIILCTDDDTNGQVLRDDLAIRLQGPMRSSPIPGDAKTQRCPLRYGEKVCRKQSNVRRYPVEGVFTFSELPEINERPVYNLGMGSFDHHHKLRRGDFTVVTGVPLQVSPPS